MGNARHKIIKPERISREELRFTPVTKDAWEEFQALFAESGVQNGCWCMYWRVARNEFQRHYGEGNRQAIQAVVASGRTPGILAMLNGHPVGWCSVAPREEFPVLDRSSTLKRVDDQPVWSIVCFFVSKPYRRMGIIKALIEAAIAHARDNGAHIVEAYPLTPESNYPLYERYLGFSPLFAELGFKEVARRSERKAVMRYFIQNGPPKEG